MGTITELLDRRSVRSFTGERIPAEDKQLILEAAVNAPSAGCQQLYTILDITDPALKEKLVHTCDEQPFIAEADLVLIFCADCRKWYEGFRDTGGPVPLCSGRGRRAAAACRRPRVRAAGQRLRPAAAGRPQALVALGPPSRGGRIFLHPSRENPARWYIVFPSVSRE